MTDASARPNADDDAGPYHGLRVIDLTQMLAGPGAAALLADLGADVIKVENPAAGDPVRAVAPAEVMFNLVNHNKRGVALDLKSTEGRATVLRLIGTCDVLVEAFRPGVRDRLGLDDETLRADNPRLIIASLTGYGATGPWASRGGFDAVLQAESGMMSITGEPDRPPMKVGFQLIDQVAGLNTAHAIAVALFDRERTGRGTNVDINLYDSALYLQGYQLALCSATGTAPRRTGNVVPHATATAAFDVSDGTIVVNAGIEAGFVALCRSLDLDEILTDPRFADRADRLQHRDELHEIIGERLRDMVRADALQLLDEHGVIAAPVRSLDEVLDDDQALANETFSAGASDRAQYRLIRPPFHFAGRRYPDAMRTAPRLGADTVNVLREIGYSDADIERLIEVGAAATS